MNNSGSVSRNTALPASNIGLSTDEPQGRDDYCARALATIVEVLNCIWETFKQFIAFVSCGYLCAQEAAPAASSARQESQTPPSIDRFKAPLIAAIRENYNYPEAKLRAVIDRLFEIIRSHEITNITLEKSSTDAYYIVITSLKKTDLVRALEVLPKKVSFETDSTNKFGVPYVDQNQIAIQIYSTMGNTSWMDPFVEQSN